MNDRWTVCKEGQIVAEQDIRMVKDDGGDGGKQMKEEIRYVLCVNVGIVCINVYKCV